MNGLLKVGKAIVIQGAMAVTLSAGITILSVASSGGTDALKNLDLDKLLK